MGLLDGLAGLAGAVGGGGQGAPGVAGALAELLSHQQGGGAGGLGALVQAFEQQGLGHIINSWIGTGPNQPVTAAQLQQVLGGERLQAIAGRLGVSPDALAGQLAATLPQLIDHLTPNGTIPQGGLLQQALSALRTQAGT
jgi:uncharacterized protein YidB (DUF937 family)